MHLVIFSTRHVKSNQGLLLNPKSVSINVVSACKFAIMKVIEYQNAPPAEGCLWLQPRFESR